MRIRPLDFGVDRESPYFLASRPTFRAAVGDADIDRIVAVRSRVSQAHPTGAPTTADNPLQQCVAFTRRAGPARIVATDIVRKLPSVRHELVPVEISRVGILETDRPILRRDGHRPDPVAAGLPPQRVRASPAIDVGASIGRVLQDVDHAGAIRRSPDNVMGRRTVKRSHRKQQVSPAQISHDGLGAAQLPEFCEDQAQPLLHFLVRIEGDAAIAHVDQPGGKRQPQFTPRRLLAFPLMESDLDLMQFRFAHDPRQAQEQPVMVGRRIV